jgi:hypothetical protein
MSRFFYGADLGSTTIIASADGTDIFEWECTVKVDGFGILNPFQFEAWIKTLPDPGKIFMSYEVPFGTKSLSMISYMGQLQALGHRGGIRAWNRTSATGIRATMGVSNSRKHGRCTLKYNMVTATKAYFPAKYAEMLVLFDEWYIERLVLESLPKDIPGRFKVLTDIADAIAAARTGLAVCEKAMELAAA